METNFRICAVIPVYRHGETVRGVLQSLADLKIPAILVDDGNTEPDKSKIAEAAAAFPGTELVVLSKNRGKGGAVSEGLLRAYELGYTHSLQVDADGQHDASSFAFFEKAARKKPGNLIAGFPLYDASVPKSREIGRKITNFWVMLETLSFDIPDSMCGFRVYPLKLVCPVLKKGLFDYRMGFDIEIFVRLHWTGIQFSFYPVKVVYPENGVSNFRVFRDNAAISKTHALMFLGMILRLPKLLLRRLRKR